MSDPPHESGSGPQPQHEPPIPPVGEGNTTGLPAYPPQQSSPNYGPPQTPAMPGPGYGPPAYGSPPASFPPVTISAKNPALHLIVSIFLPGVGSMMSDRVGIGVAILLLYILAIVLDVTVVGAIVGIPLGVGVWIWGLVDAYKGAQNWNRSHGIVS